MLLPWDVFRHIKPDDLPTIAALARTCNALNNIYKALLLDFTVHLSRLGGKIYLKWPCTLMEEIQTIIKNNSLGFRVEQRVSLNAVAHRVIVIERSWRPVDERGFSYEIPNTSNSNYEGVTNQTYFKSWLLKETNQQLYDRVLQILLDDQDLENWVTFKKNQLIAFYE